MYYLQCNRKACAATCKKVQGNEKFSELKKKGRLKSFLSEEQKEVIDKAYDDGLLSPKLLYYELKRKGGYAPKIRFTNI